MIQLKGFNLPVKYKNDLFVHISGDYKEGYYLGIELSEDQPDAHKPFYGPNRWPSEGKFQERFDLKV